MMKMKRIGKTEVKMIDASFQPYLVVTIAIPMVIKSTEQDAFNEMFNPQQFYDDFCEIMKPDHAEDIQII